MWCQAPVDGTEVLTRTIVPAFQTARVFPVKPTLMPLVVALSVATMARVPVVTSGFAHRLIVCAALAAGKLVTPVAEIVSSTPSKTTPAVFVKPSVGRLVVQVGPLASVPVVP